MSARGLEGREQEFLDSLHVMEVGMRHFFAKAMHAKTNKGKPEIIDANMLQAVSIAEKIAPYRHARLSAVKLAGDPNNPVRFKDDATADELREEIMRRLSELQEAGVIKGWNSEASRFSASINRASTGSDFYTIRVANCANQCHAAQSVCVKQCRVAPATYPA